MDPREFPRREGTTLCGKYTLEKLIGSGGMAAVYRGTHRNGHKVAVKILHTTISLDPNIRPRFLREGYAANKVGHPGVVRVTDDDIAEDGAAFLVMDLLEGKTLRDHIADRGGLLTVGEIVPLVCQLLEVLVAAHRKGIVHRDIKPDNLFLERETGALKVLDFGIARMEGGHRATRTGGLMGTPGYMAPEQARGQTRLIGPQSDVWSVGAVLFRSLSGHPVFRDETPEMTLIKTAMEPPPPLASLAPQIDPELCEIVDRALAFDKEHRWPSAESLLQALRAFDARRPSNGREPSPEPDEDSSLAESITDPMVPAVPQRTLPLPPKGVAPRVDDIAAGRPNDPAMGTILAPAPLLPAPDPRTGLTQLVSEQSILFGIRSPAASAGNPAASDSPGAAKRSPWLLAIALGVPVLLVLVAFAIAGPRAGTSKAVPTPFAPSANTSPSAEPEATMPSATDSAVGDVPVLVSPPLASAKPAPSAKRVVSCTPKYYYDKNGLKHYKEECL